MVFVSSEEDLPVGVATLGSPLYCNPQGEKDLVGVALEGGVTFPLDCLETEDRPFRLKLDGMVGVAVEVTAVVFVGVACVP